MKVPKLFPIKPRKKLHATARRVAPPAVGDYDSEEPQTKLSSAFVVVLILHIVAVGGIYAFNSIKAHRKTDLVAKADPAPVAKSGASTAAAKIAVPENSNVTNTRSLPPAPIAPVSGARVYHVKSGDTLTRIAMQHQVTVAELEQLNGIKNVALLREGQVLTIPPARPAKQLAKRTETTPKPSAAPATKTYTVVKGDSLVGIARKLGVSQTELTKLNKIRDPKKLQPGQTLKVPSKKN